MKALAINGSPRKGGNTEFLLTRCLSKIAGGGIETELVQIGGTNIRGCIACGYCRQHQNNTCSIKNDCFHEIYAKMCAADILIVGSPVYFGSAVPETMALLDRAGYVGRPQNVFSRKIGGPVAVARRAGHNFTYAQLSYWFMINDMVMPGSTYWNVSLARDLGEAEQDEEGIKTVERFGENLLWLAQKLRG